MDGYQIVPSALLQESLRNTRKSYNEGKLAELADSIQAKGILTPLLGRPVGDRGMVEIAAGHRRFRAGVRAGLEAFPVVVRTMDDDEFLEILAIENLQREDVHPLEEAEGYWELLARPGFTVGGVAAKVGKTDSYIYGRLKLLELAAELQADFLADRFSATHALLLARLMPADQLRLRKECLYDEEGAACSAADLRREIERSVYLDLARAPWDTADADLIQAAGACVTCTKRTGSQQALFQDGMRGDHCMDPACYHRKEAAFVRISMAAAKKEAGAEVLRVSGRYEWQQNKKAKGTSYDGEWKPAKEGECASAKPAVVVEINPHRKVDVQVGQRIHVCLNRKCPKHWSHSAGSAPATPAQQRKRLEQEKAEAVESQYREELLGAFLAGITWPLPELALREVARAIFGRLWLDRQVEIAKRWGVSMKAGEGRDEPMRDRIMAMGADDLARLLYEIAFSSWGVSADGLTAVEYMEAAMAPESLQQLRAGTVAAVGAAFQKKEARLAVADRKRPGTNEPPKRRKKQEVGTHA